MSETELPDDEQSIDRELFEEAIVALNAAEEAAQELQEEYADIETGLSQSDTVALLYGRRNSLNKTEIESGLDTLDTIGRESHSTLVKRLLADLSDLNQAQAQEVLSQLEDIRRRYGE